MTEIPEDLLYTDDHMWVRAGNGDEARVGLTEVVIAAHGDVVEVDLPRVGDVVGRGDSCAQVEFPDKVWEVDSPVTGEVLAVNDVVAADPRVLVEDPYGDGWLMSVRLDDPSEVDELLDADGYAAGPGADGEPDDEVTAR